MNGSESNPMIPFEGDGVIGQQDEDTSMDANESAAPPNGAIRLASLSDRKRATVLANMSAASKKRAATGTTKASPQHRMSSGGGALGQTRCVVKLLVQKVLPSYTEPWRRSSQSASSGTGFMVEGKKILTNAHVIKRASHVRARKSSSPVMYSCTVEWVSYPLDLALLSVNDEDAFFSEPSTTNDTKKNGNNFLTLSTTLPRLDENVTCVGFPTGGEQISVTRGVVSRVDVDGCRVLRVQIDAAINPGNSGGPVFDERGKVVGVASSHLKGGSNIGYIIPSLIVEHFWSMCQDGMEASLGERSVLGFIPDDLPKMVPGIARMGILNIQSLENKSMRKSLGLVNYEGGVRIAGVITQEDTGDLKDDDQDQRLMPEDVLMAIEGEEIGQDGTVRLSKERFDERINYCSLFTRHRAGHSLNVSILRKGKRMDLTIDLWSHRYVCPSYDSFDAHPSYVVCAGCVFVPLSHPWISSHKASKGGVASGIHNFYSYSNRMIKAKNEQIIVLSKVLADEVNVGYHNLRWIILRSVNGNCPENLRDLVNLIVNCKEPNIEFRLFQVHQDETEVVVCLDREECQKAEDRIMQRHMIASWCSEDVVPLDMKGVEKCKTMNGFVEQVQGDSMVAEDIESV